jgi:tyrosyl-tRNA synthetase
MEAIGELLTRGVANIISDKESLKKELEKRKLNIYFGIDPTGTHVHLGHAFPLRQLQKFAEMGHHVTFLIGDFTSLIGDTSDKESERPVLTSEQIEENFKTYKKQAEKILDFSKVTVKHNSEWLSKLTFTDIVKLCQHFSVGDFISRELIKKRLNSGTRVGLHEVLYPVMQGYDSYFMDTDLQLGGTDQTFNMQAGRTLQKILRNKESFVMTNEFLTGTDGRKMSKTWGNAIWLTDAPDDMFGKIMSVQDNLILEYFLLGTDLPIEKIKEKEERLQKGENPMQIKKELAHQIVKELHSEKDAEQAQENFEQVFQKRDVTVALQPLKLELGTKQPLVDVIAQTKAVSSKSEARRLIEQGAVEYGDEKITDPMQTIKAEKGKILKIGKRSFFEVQ